MTLAYAANREETLYAITASGIPTIPIPKMKAVGSSRTGILPTDIVSTGSNMRI
jgi:hypothetical protein